MLVCCSSDLSYGGGGGYTGRSSAPPGSTTCLRVRGLPFQSTEEDLTGFFSEVSVYPLRLHRNTGSGEAFVEFSSTNDLQIAMQKNKVSKEAASNEGIDEGEWRSVLVDCSLTARVMCRD
jgi:RNA recognition motif-containing protein